jgi:hypothetical protein
MTMMREQNRNSDAKSGARYVWLTRYENEASRDLENSGSGSIKNFPKTFIPMKELEESTPVD